jgi:nardilysin
MKESEPSECIYGEIQKIEELDFPFGEEKQPDNNVETLCENMHLYPLERYLDGDDLMFEFNPDVLADCLNRLHEDSVNIFIMAKDIPGNSLDHEEPWFGTCYSMTDISPSWIMSWREDTSLVGQFHLPHNNKFIADNTSLVKPDAELSRFPVRIGKDKVGELF